MIGNRIITSFECTVGRQAGVRKELSSDGGSASIPPRVFVFAPGCRPAEINSISATSLPQKRPRVASPQSSTFRFGIA
jgi:hypothetical protein